MLNSAALSIDAFTMTRLLGYGILTVITLAGLVLVLLFSVDLGRFRQTIEPIASSALGRELVINGPIHLDFGKTITVTARDISLGNPAWTEDPVFMSFEALTLEIDTASLLQRRLVIERLRLHALNLDLESRMDGPANWSFDTTESETPEAHEDSGGGSIVVLVKETSIDATRIEFSGPMVSEPVILRLDNLNQSINDAGFFEVTLAAALNDAPVKLKAELGTAKELQALGEVAIRLSGSAGKIDFGGDARVKQLSSLEAPRASLRLEGPSFRYLADLLKLRTTSDGPLKLEINLTPGDTGHHVELDGQFATIRARVSGSMPDLQSLQGATLTADIQGQDFAGFETALGLPLGKPGAFQAELVVESRGANQTQLALSAEVAGMQVDARGNAQNLTSGLSGSAFDLQWRASSLAASLTALDIAQGPQVAMAGSADIRVTQPGELATNYVLRLGENALEGTARLDFSNARWSIVSPFDITLPSPQQLLPPSEEPVAVPAALQDLELGGLFSANPEHSSIERLTVPGDLLNLVLDATWSTADPLAAPRLTLQGSGERFSALFDGLPTQLDGPFTLRGSISHYSAQQVSAQFDLAANDASGSVVAEINTAGADLSVAAALKAAVLGSDVDGDIALTLSDPPQLDLSLHSGLLDLRPWSSPDDTPSPESDDAPDDGRLIPDVDVSAISLPQLEGTLTYRADRVETAVEHIDELAVSASLKDPKLLLKQLAFRGQGGGTFSASGEMEIIESGLDAWIRLRGENVSIGMPAQDPAEVALLPRYDVSMAYTGKGGTVREMAADSHGYLRFASGPGKIDVSAMQLFTGDIMLELLNTVNPFSRKDRYSDIECSVLQATVEKGVLVGEPLLVVESDKLHILAQARLDLHTERIEADFNTVPKKGLGIGLSNLINPYVHLGGTLAAPVLGVDSDSALVSGGATLATGGLSILAKGVWDRMSLGDKSCEVVLARGQEKFDRLESLYGSGAKGDPES